MARAVQSRPCEVQGRGSSGTDLPGLGPHQIRMFLEAQVPWPGQLWGKLEPPGGAKLQPGPKRTGSWAHQSAAQPRPNHFIVLTVVIPKIYIQLKCVDSTHQIMREGERTILYFYYIK